MSSRTGFGRDQRQKLLGRKDGIEDEDRKLNVAADVDASWEKVKRMCLYSADTAFTQHKHDKYSLQTKNQKPADKGILEGQLKLQADSGRIRGTRDSINIAILKNVVFTKTAHAL